MSRPLPNRAGKQQDRGGPDVSDSENRFCHPGAGLNIEKEKGLNGETMPTFACKDLGMECPFTASAPTDTELMKKIAEHAKTVHKIDPVPADMIMKIKKAIKK